MTRLELNGVRFLMRELKQIEQDLNELRKASSGIVQSITGLPRGSPLRSKVEALATEIVRQEERVESYKAAIAIAKMGLVEWILTRKVTIPEQRVTLLRFVDGLTAKEIRVRTGFSTRHVNRLTSGFLKKCHLDSLELG